MKKVIAIMGPSGCGKDLLLNEVIRDYKELHPIISCTSRPPRTNEKGGKDYYFLTEETFRNRLNDFLEYTDFNGWLYGTLRDEIKDDKINIGVFNVNGVKALINSRDVDCRVFYLATSDRTRLLRQLERDNKVDVDEVVRRYKADKDMFNIVALHAYGISPNNIIVLASETIKDLHNNISIIGEYADQNAWAKSDK